MSRSLLRSVLPVVAGALLVAGCGGGEGGSSEGSTDAFERKQPIAAEVPAFEKAVAGRDCQDSIAVMHRVTLSEPEKGATKQNCIDALYITRDLEDFEPGKAAEFGSAAILDGTVNGKGFSPIWALDQQGEFRWAGSFARRPQVETELESPEQFKRTAGAFLAAMRAGDCRAAHALLQPGDRLAYDNVDTFCKLFAKNYTASPEGLGSRLKKDPDAELVEFGGTKDWAFYGLATEPAGYRTIIVGAGAEGQPPRVVDVVPAER